MDWVHCNKCLVRPSDKVSFELTSCGHLICLNCKITSKEDKNCPVCSVQCTSVSLTPPLPSQVEIYFTDPILTLKKARQAFNFQEKNRLKLEKAQIVKAESTLKDLEKKCQILKQENQYLKNLVSQVTSQSQAGIARTPSTARPPFVNRQFASPLVSQRTRDTPLSMLHYKATPK